jgi:hypothetical protein
MASCTVAAQCGECHHAEVAAAAEENGDVPERVRLGQRERPALGRGQRLLAARQEWQPAQLQRRGHQQLAPQRLPRPENTVCFIAG